MSPAASPIRFGSFELDLQSGELRREGLKIRLADQPLQVLALLLEHPGAVVTREQLQKRLWSSDTFVDFEHSLNAAVKRLREALGDSADTPRFIETLPRHGYRLIVPVESRTAEKQEPKPSEVLQPTGKRSRWWWAAAVILAVAAVALLATRRMALRSPALAPVAIHSLAVLPLENLSRDPREEYFSDGMTEALITELGRIRALRVISRQSAMHYKGTTLTVPQIAKELNVDALVEGSAMRDGGTIRISAQLIRVQPEEHLWAQSYERDSRDIIALQRNVARDIALQIQVALTPQERIHLEGSRPRNPNSYDEYLQARYFQARWTKEDARKAFLHAQRAVDLDPNDAASYALLSTTYFTLESFGEVTPEEAERGEAAAAKRALELDDTLAEAHAAIGWVKMVEWDWAGAEKELKRAIELNPGSVSAHTNYSWYLTYLGRHDQAIEEMRKVVDIEPLSVWAQTGMGYRLCRARRYDESIAQFRKTLELEPGNATLHRELAKVLTAKGSYSEAIEEFQRERALYNQQPSPYLVVAYVQVGQHDAAVRILEQNRAYWSEKIPYFLAIAYTGLGEKDKAFSWLEKMYRIHDPRLLQVNVEPGLDPLRADPRFQNLVRRMNLLP